MLAVEDTGLSTLADNYPGDSRFWTVSPGLKIRDWNLKDNRQSLNCYFLWIQLSDNKISNILGCLSYLTVNLERFLKNSGMPL